MRILESYEVEQMNHRIGRVLKVIAFVVVAAAIFGFIIMHLWNWLMPGIFGLHTITYWQGLGLSNPGEDFVWRVPSRRWRTAPLAAAYGRALGLA